MPELEKFRGSIRDWILAARERGIDLDRLDSDKQEDARNLEKSGLPIYDSFRCLYIEFTETNKLLSEFIARYNGFVVRALPLPHRKDLQRKPKIGLCSFRECREFLKRAVEGNEQDYSVLISEWGPQDYGGILISGDRYIFGEIGRGLDTLSFGHETPLASFEIDRAKVGHLENKTEWKCKEDKRAKNFLWKALYYIKKGSDNFDPYFIRGYFEFVVTETEKIRFVDFKDNERYLV